MSCGDYREEWKDTESGRLMVCQVCSHKIYQIHDTPCNFCVKCGSDSFIHSCPSCGCQVQAFGEYCSSCGVPITLQGLQRS